MPRMRAADAAGLALSIGAERALERGQIAQWQPLLDYCAGNPLTLRIIVGQAVRMGLQTEKQIAAFIQDVRDGEQQIQDADEAQGRDRSLGASLDYGFHHAFVEDELPAIALLHLFQGTVDIDALAWMGEGEYALPELAGRTKEQLTGLLERAGEVGLLTHLGGTWYGIHPALPWFLRQLFAGHYDGGAGRATATAALRAWVEAIGALGNYYIRRFAEGNRDVIGYLILEEANLLHARRAARRHGWWDLLLSAMQGLRVLYDYQGRLAEWARLVAEITPDYCTAEDAPLPRREDGYTLVMEYRVRLATDHDRDLPRAAALQEKVVAWNRRQAAPALALPPDAPLDDDQRHRIRNLSVSVFTFGQIMREQGSPNCVAAYEESLSVDQRLGDTAGEAITHMNLGLAYKDLPAIRDLDTAEAAFQRSLALRNPNDALGRSKCLQSIGMVHHERFNESRQRDEPEEAVLVHAQAAEQHYLQALDLCPPSAIADLAPMHHQLGKLYADVGETEPAREQFEKAAQFCERIGNHYNAGIVRHGMAITYLRAAEREPAPARRRDLLRRGQAYAEASLADFQSYQGRAADEEANAQELIDDIAQALAQL